MEDYYDRKRKHSSKEEKDRERYKDDEYRDKKHKHKKSSEHRHRDRETSSSRDKERKHKHKKEIKSKREKERESNRRDSVEEKKNIIPQPKPEEVQRATEPENKSVRRRAPMIPMTKEEYDKKQSVVREVYDPLSGRTRLIRGDGEVIERIVTKERQREINQLATKVDGLIYQSTIKKL